MTILLVLYTKKEVKNIKASYNQYIKIKKDTNIYDKNKKVIGKVYKGTELELEKLNKITANNKNLKVKNCNYYIYYKDNKKVITINNDINLPIQYINDNKYYVYYLNKLLEVKKSNKIKEIDHENTKENSTSHISILLYDTINDTCTNNENCTSTESIKNQINKLLENG